MRRIEKLETETSSKQRSLETLRREKVELENTLEQEQEALVNKLWKKMDQLETEKRYRLFSLSSSAAEKKTVHLWLHPQMFTNCCLKRSI